MLNIMNVTVYRLHVRTRFFLEWAIEVITKNMYRMGLENGSIVKVLAMQA